MTDTQGNKYRILAVDDEENILETYRQILCPVKEQDIDNRLAEMRNKLFSGASYERQTAAAAFELDVCLQGEEAVAKVEAALQEGRPYGVAFIDMRMPPGQNGLWTAEQLRTLDPLINIVIVTAYSDVHPADIARMVPPADRLLYMQKPFLPMEIEQFAHSMAAKYQAENSLIDINNKLSQAYEDISRANEDLEERVREKTRDLAASNQILSQENEQRRQTEEQLRKSKQELLKKANDFEGLNTALNILFRKKEEERRELEQKILFNVKEMIEPYVEKLRNSGLNDPQNSFLNIIESNLEVILAPFMRDLAHKYFRLSNTEVHIANLIKQGKKSKEIGELMNLSSRTIEFYRDRIRKKIGIKNKKENLKGVLKNLDIGFHGN